jgi:hypothetical protein
MIPFKIIDIYIKKHFSNPMHLTEELAIYLALKFIKKTCIVVTPKVDGINKTINIQDKCNIEAEIVGNDAYIIDVLEPATTGNFTKRLMYVSKLFNSTILRTASSREDIENILLNHSQHRVSNHNNINLFVKPVIKLEISKMSDECILDILSYLYSADYATPYPNDGWIIYTTDDKMNYCKYPIKLKPSHQLTIDMKYIDGLWYMESAVQSPHIDNNGFELENNNIYSLLYISEHTFKITRKRTDKITPNTDRIYQNIRWISENKCNLVEMYNKCRHIQEIYYSPAIHPINIHIKLLLNNLKSILFENINTIINESCIDTVIDIGCGKSALAKEIKQNVIYLGIDPDPYILTRYLAPRDNIYKTLSSENIDIYNDVLLNNRLIVMNNSLYYFDDLNILNKLKKHNTLVYICNIFADNSTSIVYSNDFYVKQHDNSDTWLFRYPWIGKELKQRIIHTSEIIDKIHDSGWNLEYINDIKCPAGMERFQKFYDMHKIVVLKST